MSTSTSSCCAARRRWHPSRLNRWGFGGATCLRAGGVRRICMRVASDPLSHRLARHMWSLHPAGRVIAGPGVHHRGVSLSSSKSELPTRRTHLQVCSTPTNNWTKTPQCLAGTSPKLRRGCPGAIPELARVFCAEATARGSSELFESKPGDGTAEPHTHPTRGVPMALGIDATHGIAATCKIAGAHSNANATHGSAAAEGSPPVASQNARQGARTTKPRSACQIGVRRKGDRTRAAKSFGRVAFGSGSRALSMRRPEESDSGPSWPSSSQCRSNLGHVLPKIGRKWAKLARFVPKPGSVAPLRPKSVRSWPKSVTCGPTPAKLGKSGRDLEYRRRGQNQRRNQKCSPDPSTEHPVRASVD